MEKKSYISSFLREDFGVEDLIAGRTSSNSFGMEDFDVVNKLGLMSALNDINNTDPTNFGIESAMLLGEAKQFSLFATQKLGEMNERFAICADIKKKYGVEGLDPLAYGTEGFVDGVKKVGAAIAAAAKKIAQSVMNFIRSVGNAIGSTLALTQVKLYEQNKDKKFESGKGGYIKAMVHKVKFTEQFSKLNGRIVNLTNVIDTEANKIMKIISGATGSGGAAEKSIKDLEVIKINIKKAESEAMKEISKTLELTTKSEQSVSETVRAAIFGSSTAKPTKMKAGDYMSGIANVGGIKILSRDYLESCKILTKVGQSLVKSLNATIKRVDASMRLTQKIVSNKSVAGDKAAGKESSKAVKLSRNAMSALNMTTTVSGHMSSVILITFASFLKCRGYCASAVRRYSKKSGDETEE